MGVTAGASTCIGASVGAERSKDKSVLGVCALTDPVLLTTVNAVIPSKKETSLKEILFTVTPRQ
jgi:hypothetical protein